MKRYDRAYFDKWYRGRGRITSDAEVRRKVTLAVSEAEYFLRRSLHSVLDVACGEGAWFPHIKALRPRASYRGIDPSDYAVSAFGKKRHIEKGTFRDVERVDGMFDLVVCADAVWLEVLTREDLIIGDMKGLIRRPAKWYRRQFAEVGLTQVGPYTWLAPWLHEEAATLEIES